MRPWWLLGTKNNQLLRFGRAFFRIPKAGAHPSMTNMLEYVPASVSSHFLLQWRGPKDPQILQFSTLAVTTKKDQDFCSSKVGVFFNSDKMTTEHLMSSSPDTWHPVEMRSTSSIEHALARAVFLNPTCHMTALSTPSP